MKTTISLPVNDKCKCCELQCPKNIYDCQILTELINKKKVNYIWEWIPKE